MKINRINIFIIAILFGLIIVLAGCSTTDDSKSESDTNDSAQNADNEEQTTEGTLRVALSAQPTTLDQPISTNTSTRDISRMIFETLVTTNAEFQPVPMLAESIDVSEDGKTYTFHLREGIKFHNGNDMTSEDVVASMYRWLDKSAITGTIFNDATFTAEDDYTVVLALVEPSALVMDILASTKMSAAIMPKEIVESAPEEGISEYIGTGPFKFEEWKSDQYVHLTKFDDYQSLEEEASGLGGKKEALVDDIYFEFVTDPATQLAGLQTGEYHVAYALPFDNYELIMDDPNLDSILEKLGEYVLIYNKVEGPASSFKIREAINTGLNIEEIMIQAFTHEDIYSMEPGYMTEDIANWASDAGSDFYNLNDQEKAKQLLEEAGYNGEEFTLMTTRDYPHMYNASVVIQEQLTNLGMNVKLEVYDWPTLADKRDNSFGEWDAFVNGLTTVTTPTQLLAISPTYAGGVQDEKIIDLTEQIATASSQEEAKQIWDELQGYAYEHHLPVSLLGKFHTLYGKTDQVEGIFDHHGLVYWNVSVKE